MTHDGSTRGPQEALARLRAADPAPETVDLDALRAAVRERLAAEGPADAGGAETEWTDARGGTDELASRRRARLRRTGWSAAAAVAALACVAGGYALGSRGPEEVGPVPVATLSTQEPPGEAGGGIQTRGGTAETSGESESAEETSLPDAAGPAVFTAEGLSTEAGAAEAYAFDADPVASAAGVTRLAEALGIAGEAREEDGRWTAGSPEDRLLQVTPDGIASFTYTDAGAGADTESGAQPPRDAVTAAQELATDLGLDAEDLAWEERGSDGPITHVEAVPLVDGEPVADLIWSVQVAGDRILEATGALARVAPLGEVGIVSETEAVDRLNDPRFEVVSGAGEVAVAEGAPATGAPPAPEPGEPLPWPVEEVTIVAAETTLTPYALGSGAVVLLPAYELTDASGRSWAVVAVAEEHLAFG